MPFEYEDPGDDFELIEEDGESFVVAYVGADTDTGFTYYAATALSPFFDYVEYSFYIVERWPNGTERQFDSGQETKGVFNEADRTAILGVIILATELLLDWKQPPLVDRCTSDADLPNKAQLKHTSITGIFRSCGYKVTSCGDWNGKLVWRAETVAEGLHEE